MRGESLSTIGEHERRAHAGTTRGRRLREVASTSSLHNQLHKRRARSCVRRNRRRTSRSPSPGETKARNRKVAQMIDQKCRYLFPATFIAFNLFYWLYYKCYA